MIQTSTAILFIGSLIIIMMGLYNPKPHNYHDELRLIAYELSRIADALDRGGKVNRMRAIDGDALMERLGIAYDCRECDQDKSPYCTWKPDAVDVCQIIADAPTIEPERKTGWWIIKETAYEDTEAKCSCCGFEMLVDQPGNGLHMVNDLHYCPHCGADMRGEKNG